MNKITEIIYNNFLKSDFLHDKKYLELFEKYSIMRKKLIEKYNITDFELLLNLEECYDNLSIFMEEKFVEYVFDILKL